ncbi:MAG: hypothetical protein ACPGU1_09185 [Myxococcota bacterium]
MSGALRLGVCLCLLFGALDAQAVELTVTVLNIADDGTSSMVAEREVAVETWRTVPGPTANRELDAVMHGRTSVDGVARFELEPAARGAERVATVVYDGLTYTSEPVAAGVTAVTLRVYEATGTPSQLVGRMTVGLDVRDGFVIVDTTLVLFNRERTAVDTRRTGTGLRLPLALPAVFDGPWEAGVIPSDTGPRHVSLRQSPEHGRFQFLDGAIFYQGPVLPGRPTTLQVRYGLPIIAERQDVALTTSIDLEQLMVTTTWTDRVAPRVVPDREFLAVGRQPGEAVQRFMRVEPPPKTGEAFLVRVDRLPQPHAVQNQLAVGGGVCLAVLFGLSLVALRRRDD